MSLQYRIAEIGWYNFERIVQTLLKAIIGPGVTSFGGSKDHGRDADYEGVAAFPTKEEHWSGHWIFQVKYIDLQNLGATSSRSQLKSTLKTEMESILERSDEVPDNYILITDIPLTADSRTDLKEVARKADFHGRFHSIDGHEVCEHLTLHPEIRRSYPQLLGLADLDRIVNKELYTRSEAYLQDWQPRLSVFVQTEAYIKALKTLRQHHFIVLDGPPETGKTMIAAAIALVYASSGAEVIDVRGPDQIFATYTQEHAQIFIADDAIGSIALSPVLADAWSRDLPGILRKLDSSHVLIWTARHYILEEALAESRLGESVGEFPGTHEVLVEVGEMTTFERGEILYNHAKLGNLPVPSRKLIQDHFRAIIGHDNFTPERIRQLCENVLRSDKPKTWQDIADFMKNPTQRWMKAYAALSKSEQTLLLSMLDFEENPGQAAVELAYDHRIAEHEGRPLAFKEALSRLKHSFLQITRTYSGAPIINFRHPSLRDVLLGELRNDSRARKRFIERTTPVGLAGLVRGLGPVIIK